MIKLALVGGAHIHTPGFIKRLNARDDVAVTSVWDRDTTRAEARAEALGAETVQNLASIWADAEIAAVVICSETCRHETLVLAAAEAGKPMFVEKPLGMGAKDAHAMATAIEAAGVLFQTGYFMRGTPVHRFLREHIEKGSFGTITRIRHSTCHAGSLKGLFDTEWRWMADLTQAGCGAFGDLGTHSLDILMWLMGDVERVTAAIDQVTDRYPGCDEFGESLLRFKSGAIGSLAAGWVDVADPVKVQVSGTEGHAYTVGEALYFQSEHVEGADGKEPWPDLPEQQPHAFDLFLDAITGKDGVTLVSPREAAERSAVMEAIYAAAEEGTWVSPTMGDD